MENTTEQRASGREQSGGKASAAVGQFSELVKFSATHTGASQAVAESLSLCISNETRLGTLQAIRSNVMPQWEFRKEKKNKSKGVKYEERHRR